MAKDMNTKKTLLLAGNYFRSLTGHIFDVLTIAKPISPDGAVNLAKVVSKLSPILGNLIEYNSVEFLNSQEAFKGYGKWERQDPGFPDAIFKGSIIPPPGMEIKAWFPLATEITARFKDSQNSFKHDEIHVALLAWLPDNLIFGKPQIVDVCVVSAKSIAKARDEHYHNPPDYLVIEPEDTSARTSNLQQTNTNGYKWQGTSGQYESAKRLVKEWGAKGHVYFPTREYQKKLRDLISRYPYRLDTNFAKIDRIGHSEIEEFKMHVLSKKIHGHRISEWISLLFQEDSERVKYHLAKTFSIGFEGK